MSRWPTTTSTPHTLVPYLLAHQLSHLTLYSTLDRPIYGLLPRGAAPVARRCNSLTGQSLTLSSSKCLNKRRTKLITSLNSSFRISYGSGQASGTLGQDVVSMGGYSVASQTFAYCNTISQGLISGSVSGIMGLSWQSLAYSGGELF